MFNNNTSYQEAINAPSRRITGSVTIKGQKLSDDISSIDYVSSISGNTLTIGATNASTVDIKFKKLIEGLAERELIKVSFSVQTSSGIVERQIGEFFLTEIKLDRNNKTTTLKAMDKMAFLNDKYTSTLLYPTLGRNIVQEIANSCNLRVNNNLNITNLPSFSKKLEKVTYREMLGYLAQTVGAFVIFNNNGELEFRKLNRTQKQISKGSYLLKGLEVDEVEYRINGISISLNNQEKTILAVGSPLGTQVKLTNPLMTQGWLNSIFSEYSRLRFNPFKLNWRGDPFVEVGDWVSIEIANGSYRAFPILELKLSYSGGLKSTIGANVKGTTTSTTEYKGTVERQIEFINARLGASGNYVYADTVEPTNPKEGDTWFKPNGAFTDLYIYENNQWVLKTSTGNIEGLITKITDSSVSTQNLATAIAKIIELDAARITTGSLTFEQLSSNTVSEIRKGMVSETKFNSFVNDSNGLRQQMSSEIERVVESKKSTLKGQDGTSSYIHRKYSDNANGTPMSDNSNLKYIGIYTGNKQQAPTNPSEYSWTKIRGEDGARGRDGVSSYIHRKYSDYSSGYGMDDNPNRKYIGIYTGTNPTPPTTASSYLWSKIKGEDGANGVPGAKGADGRTPYFHTAYANSPTGDRDFSTTNSNDKLYIGTYSDFEVADSTDYRKYKWVKIKGENGRNGSNGRDGVSSYIYRKYSDNANGSPMSDNSNLKYIGIYTGTSATAPTTPTSYTWSKIKGEDGAQGVPGARGTDGRTSYLHTAYANSSTGERDFSTTNSTGKEYIGTYTDFEINDSNDYRRYKWVKIKGENGRDGKSINENLLRDSGEPLKKEGHSWGGDWEVRTHPYYYNGGKKLMCLPNSTTRENFIRTHRIKLKRNTEYAISFKGFASANVSSMDLHVLGRRNNETSDFTIFTRPAPIINSRKLSPNGIEAVKNIRFNSGEMDEAFLRFDNNGSTNNQQAILFITEVKLEEGTTSTEWSPAYEDLQAHTLTANLRLEGKYINNVTNGVKGYLEVFYDGQKITNGFNARIKFKGGILDTWSNFWNANVDNAGLITNLSWGDKEQQYPIALDVIVLVTYKDSNTVANARMENVPDVVEIKEVVKKYKTFESTLEGFTSVVGEINTKVLTKQQIRQNLSIEDVEKTGNDLYFNAKENLVANEYYTILADLDGVPANQKAKIYGASDGGDEKLIRNGLNYWVVKYPNNRGSINLYPLGANTKVKNVRIFKGDFRVKKDADRENLYSSSATDSGGKFIHLNLNKNKINGNVYTVKFDASGYSNGDRWDVYNRIGYDENNLTQILKSKDNEFTFTINDNTMADRMYIRMKQVGNTSISNVEIYDVSTEYVKNSQVSKLESSITQTKNEIDLKVSKDNVINSINISAEGTRIKGDLIADYLYGKTIEGAVIQGNSKIKIGKHGYMIPAGDGLRFCLPEKPDANKGVGVQMLGNYGRDGDTAYGFYLYVDPNFDTREVAGTNSYLMTVNGYISTRGVNNLKFQNYSDNSTAIGVWDKNVSLLFDRTKNDIYYEWNGKIYSIWQMVDRFYSTTSDARLKKDIRPCGYKALDLINDFKFKSFNWEHREQLEEKPFTEIGLIAQDVEKISKNFVSTAGEYKTLNQFNLLTYSLKAIQELSTENQQLKSQLKEMNERLTKLEDKINGNL